MRNTFLLYKLDIKTDKPVSDSIHGKIKYNINLEELSKSPECYHNQDVFKYMLEKYNWARNYVTDSALEIFDCHVIDYTVPLESDNTAKVFILFFSLKREELLIPDVINKDHCVKTIINQHIMRYNNIGCNSIYNDYRFDQFINELSKNPDPILDLRFQPLPICKTNLYDYQRDNIRKMIDIEANLPIIDFPYEHKLFDLGPNIGLYFNYDMSANPDCFIPYGELPKRQVKGGVICDETGLGKTVQMISLALSNPDINTLIIVPNHIKNHWNSEIEKHFDIAKTENNILIVSYEDFNTMDIKLIQMYQRVIVDEIHELYSLQKSNENSRIFNKLMDCDHFTYRWGVSATPFPDRSSMNNLIKYIVGGKRIIQSYIANSIMIQDAIRKVFRRNIKQNVVYELKLPDVVINNVLLNFNRDEKDIYDSEMIGNENRDINFLRELCCNVLISVCQEIKNVITPIELRKLTLNRFMNSIKKEQEELDHLYEKKQNVINAMNNIISYAKEKGDILPENIISEYRHRINHLDNNINTQQQILTRRQNVFDNYKKMIDDIDSIVSIVNDNMIDNTLSIENDDMITDDTNIDDDKLCPICYSPFSGNIALFITCRHYFCRGCFERCHKERPNQCPMCRSVAEVGEINFIGNEEQQFTSTKNTEVLRLIKTTGERFIIFTQFDKLIKSITHLLKSNDINVMQYSNFADASQEDKDNTQVIVLSSNSNASGIDLSFIHNVIIMEPFENYFYGKEIEKQIIGRVHRINQVSKVNVYRLIIRNTIEETIYNMST